MKNLQKLLFVDFFQNSCSEKNTLLKKWHAFRRPIKRD